MTTTTTPLLGLNKPGKGDFDWDVPLNENWDKLDSLGAGRLPFMAPLLMEHVMDEHRVKTKPGSPALQADSLPCSGVRWELTPVTLFVIRLIP